MNRNLWVYDIPKKAGVYKISNKITKNFYIGSSKNLYNRGKTQFSKYRLNYNVNKNLQDEFNIYGEENFVFEVLEIVNNATTKKLYQKEQYYIDLLKPHFNIAKIAGSNKGYKMSYNTLKKRSEKQSIKIIQLDLNNNFIKEWKSAKQAGEILKINNCHIRECCRKLRKSAGGFKWVNK